ncbi:MAG: radical SAM protein [Nitrospinota bacterium]
MKITFLEPPPLGKKTPERFAGCSYELYHFPDLANLYPFSYLYEEGFDVNYIDASLERLDEKGFLNRIKDSPETSSGGDYYVIHSVILSKKTDLYYLKKIQEIRPLSKIIFHGPEPTRVAEEYLINKNILVFRGEIEKNLISYLKEGKFIGVSYLNNGRAVHEPPPERPVNLNELPFPFRNHHVLQPYIKNYFNPKFRKVPHTIMMTSRGCAFRCLFCVPNSISFARELEYMRYNNGKKPPVQIASAKRVIEEFNAIKMQGFHSVMIVDDQFLWGRERSLEICRGIKGLEMEWGCLSRADFLTDEEVVKAMAEAGCVSVDIGVENLNQEVLNYIQKDLKVEDVYTSVSLLKKYGIEPKLNIMFGTSPYDTSRDIKDTVERLKTLDVKNIMFSIATPFKGTKFYNFCKEKSYLIDETDEINPLGKSIISYPSLSKKELEGLERYAYRSFYLRPKMIMARIKTYHGLRDFLNDIRVAINLFKH